MKYIKNLRTFLFFLSFLLHNNYIHNTTTTYTTQQLHTQQLHTQHNTSYTTPPTQHLLHNTSYTHQI